jgi:hypothetical protein
MPFQVNIDHEKRLVSSVWAGEVGEAPGLDCIEDVWGDLVDARSRTSVSKRDPNDTHQREWNALDDMDAAKQWLRRE